MPFLSPILYKECKEKLITDLSVLGKLYKAKKSDYDTISIRPNQLEDYEKYGYTITKELKTKIRVQRKKEHFVLFEDHIWCLMYELGFRMLNLDERFQLKYGSNSNDLQQIDVVAINDDVAILIECKSSEKPKRANYKTFLEGSRNKIKGFRESIEELVGKRRVKYILATRNLKTGSEDKTRMEKARMFHLDDNVYKYIKSLVKSYRGVSLYQFLGLIFRGESISSNTIDVPALKGTMGGKKKAYYMFSIEPIHLLKMGFVLHRTRVNETESPAYQRLLVPSRLRNISKFIEDGGFFPNSIIVNFKIDDKVRLNFKSSSSENLDSNAKFGVLSIPNMYATAYIIDGQHRLYGFSNIDEEIKNSTVPVVAFINLTSDEQLDMFLDINQNQKKISTKLKLTLQEDICWSSNDVVSRMKALRSGIINRIADGYGTFNNRLSIGEDKGEFSPTFIENALKKSKGLLPKPASRHRLTSSEGVLYDASIYGEGIDKEMYRVKKYVSDFITESFLFIEEGFPDLFDEEGSYVRSNRGIYAIIYVLGSLNRYLSIKQKVNIKTSVEKRITELSPYLNALLKSLDTYRINNEDPDSVFKTQGQLAEKHWAMFFESLIHAEDSGFYTDELKEYKETKNKDIRLKAKEKLDEIECLIKENTIQQMKDIYGDSWDLEITKIKTECMTRAENAKRTIFDETSEIKEIPWTDMFMISDYINIITKHWTKGREKGNKSFQEMFSIDIENITYKDGQEVFRLGKESNKDKALKWLKKINTHRNTISHLGSKSFGLTRKELVFVSKILDTIKLGIPYRK
ncbi:MAG: DGQHR domain-containing protein [Flavobacteriaceae bacterium]|nr:DGQHR domain-containing protein [Flavobacteriaceae bacterium]